MDELIIHRFMLFLGHDDNLKGIEINVDAFDELALRTTKLFINIYP